MKTTKPHKKYYSIQDIIDGLVNFQFELLTKKLEKITKKMDVKLLPKRDTKKSRS